MKGKSLGLFVLVSGLTWALVFTACRKKEDDPKSAPDNEKVTAADNNTAEMLVSDLEGMGATVSESGTLSANRSMGGLSSSDCVTVTIVQNIVTLNFGSGCLCNDGHFRSGKVIYDFSSSLNNAKYYRNPGFRMDVSTQNYVVDNYSVTVHNKTVQNTTTLSLPTGTNPGTNLTWSIGANITINKPSGGGTITWTCNRTKELINTSDPTCYRGQAVPIDWTRARVKFDGTASGINARSESFSSVATGLICDLNCTPQPNLRPHQHPFIGGTLVYTPGTRLPRTINFGNGTDCDFSATLTINNVTVALDL